MRPVVACTQDNAIARSQWISDIAGIKTYSSSLEASLSSGSSTSSSSSFFLLRVVRVVDIVIYVVCEV
jgi:hypothetical protein